MEHVRIIRKHGGPVSGPIIVAAAKGIVKLHDPTATSTFDLGRSWSSSLIRRMGLVRRKGTQAARHVPENIEQVYLQYIYITKMAS